MPRFKDEYGKEFEGVSLETAQGLHSKLQSDVGLNPLQISENGAFCMSMVARAALGLGAAEASVLAVVSPCLAGQVVASAIRNLVNAGAEALVIVIGDEIGELASAKQALEFEQVNVELVNLDQDLQIIAANLDKFHALLLGTSNLESRSDSCPTKLIEVLNDASTPVHCVHCPPGINPEDGSRVSPALFASSTLSLGAPLASLRNAADYTGRLYVCDVGVPKALRTQLGVQIPNLFNEQPVVQIFPASQEEKE